jgi:L-malate glycosyltransferase
MDKQKPIKLLVLPSWYPPLGGSFFREHSMAMALAGTQVDVLALNAVGVKSLLSMKSMRRDFRDKLKGFYERVEPHLIFPGPEKWQILKWTDRLTNMTTAHMKKHGYPDLIHAHSSIWAGLAASAIKKTHGIPYLVTEHRGRFTAGNREAENMLLPWHIPLLKAAFGGADRVVTVSNALREKVLEISPECMDRMITIPNMVDTAFFVPGPGLPSSPFVFFCLAHLEYLKGIDILLHATHLLKKNNAGHVRVIIGGDGPQRKELESLCRILSLQDTVTFTGRLDREAVKSHLQSAHAFVLPSRFEAFGVVYIEAMACGLPVIATRAGGTVDIVRDENGILVDPGSPVDLAGAMELLVQNAGKYEQGNIRKYAIRHFSQEVIAGKYLKLYHEIINAGNRNG